MGMQVCMGGMMMCTFGMAPSSIVPTPKPIMTTNMVAANIMDHTRWRTSRRSAPARRWPTRPWLRPPPPHSAC